MTILTWTSKVSDNLGHVSLTNFLERVSGTGMSLPAQNILLYHSVAFVFSYVASRQDKGKVAS